MTSGSEDPAVVAAAGLVPGSHADLDPGVWVVIARHSMREGRSERTEVVAAYSDLRWAMAHVRTAASSHYIVRAPLDPPN